MDLTFLTILALLTILFQLLNISFISFSRISLAGFFDDFPALKSDSFDFVNRYEELANSFSFFTILLRLSLSLCIFILYRNLFPSDIIAVLSILILNTLIFDSLFFYIASDKKELVLKKLLFLYRVPWIIFLPLNSIFSVLSKNSITEDMSDQDDPSDKELEVFFEESTKEGVLEQEDKEMIESVIDFGDTLVKEIITPRVDMIYIDANASLPDLIALINKKKKSRYPVISDRIDSIDGIVLSKDVFNYIEDKNFAISKILRPAFFIPETMRISELLREFQKSRQKFAIVIDEFGGVSGLVTMEDIVEEIVGDISDEYDEDIDKIKEEEDHFIVKGDTEIYEIEDKLDIKFENDEEFQTIAGFISYKLGKIPDRLDKVKEYNHTFEVIKVEKNRIQEVKIYNG